jgi:hypothetical protein
MGACTGATRPSAIVNEQCVLSARDESRGALDILARSSQPQAACWTANGQAASGPAASSRKRKAMRAVGCRCAALLCAVLCSATLSTSRCDTAHVLCRMCTSRLTSSISRLQGLARPRKDTVPSLELHQQRQRRWHAGAGCGVACGAVTSTASSVT